MKTLYLDCGMGAAGDMLMSALLELVESPDSFITRLNYLGIPGVKVEREKAVSCGITGTRVSVRINGVDEDEHDHGHGGHDHCHGGHVHSHGEHVHSHNVHDEQLHEHNTLLSIRELINALPLSDIVKQNAIAVYELIASAESRAHGVTVEQVHFHEVGAMDAVTDIVGVCMLMEELAPDRVIASPVHVGSGQVRCAHGILPVPAPATADILRGVPIYGGSIKGELCTPTGAALLKHFVTSYGDLPVISVSAVGYGMGSRVFEVANCVRAMLGEQSASCTPNDSVTMLSCNLDDMTAEAIGFACNRLMETGALDVYTVPVYMKKNRPATMLVCAVTPDSADRLAAEMLRYTTTFGVRRSDNSRYALSRTITPVPTKYGDIRVKSGLGYGVEKMKPEYDDVARAAEDNGLSISEVLQSLGL